jgi:hypothetical protein
VAGVGRDRTFTGLEPSMPCNDKENLLLDIGGHNLSIDSTLGLL